MHPTGTPAPSQTRAPSQIAVLDGEPWLLYVWVLRGKNTRDMFLARPDGNDAHAIAREIPGDHAAPSWSADGSRMKPIRSSLASAGATQSAV